MDWDEEQKWIDKRMTYTAVSMKLIIEDLNDILKKLDKVIKGKKNG
jgi:hypothetical protein